MPHLTLSYIDGSLLRGPSGVESVTQHLPTEPTANVYPLLIPRAA